MITTSTASSDSHFEQILSLQRRNLGRALSQEQQRSEGFVFAEHSVPLLRRMAAELPQAIALSGGQVVGYCLALPLSLRGELPSLEPMFVQFARCIYKGKPLPDYRFVVGGQVCVDRPFRGQDLLKRFYDPCVSTFTLRPLRHRDRSTKSGVYPSSREDGFPHSQHVHRRTRAMGHRCLGPLRAHMNPPEQEPDQAMQRPASQPAISLMSICHPPLAAKHACSVPRIADLESRLGVTWNSEQVRRQMQKQSRA